MTEKNSAAVALITGASRRIGRQIAIELHRAGYNIAVHYHHSKDEAAELAQILNSQRTNSCTSFQADILDTQTLKLLVDKVANHWGQLDLLVNNASTFFPTPHITPNDDDWNNLMGTNLKAPYYLSLAAIPHLKKTAGNIINIVDIYGLQPLKNHSVYCMAKSALVMMTKSLAKDLAPEIRVNGVAPGAILWPENASTLDLEKQQTVINRTALKRQGSANDIAKTVRFLAMNADYVTGQIIKVDGGRF